MKSAHGFALLPLAMLIGCAVPPTTYIGCASWPWQNWQIQAGTAITSPPNTYPSFLGAITDPGHPRLLRSLYHRQCHQRIWDSRMELLRRLQPAVPRLGQCFGICLRLRIQLHPASHALYPYTGRRRWRLRIPSKLSRSRVPRHILGALHRRPDRRPHGHLHRHADR